MDDTFTEMVGYMGFSHFLHVKCQFSVSLIVCFDFECFSSMCCFKFTCSTIENACASGCVHVLLHN